MGYVLILDFGLLNVWAIQPEARGKAVHSSQIYMGGIKIEMKKVSAAIILIIFFAGFTCPGATGAEEVITGSGSIVSQERDVEFFTGLESAIPGNVFVTQDRDAAHGVRIDADDNVIDRVETAVETDENGTRLVISLQSGSYKNISISVYVSMPSVEVVALSGTGNIRSTAPIQTEEILCVLSGSGNIGLSGTATEQTAVISGSGSICNSDLVSETCSVTISGSGTCGVNVTQQLDAMITGSGTILHTGNPQVSQNIPGSGTVSQGQPACEYPDPSDNTSVVEWHNSEDWEDLLDFTTGSGSIVSEERDAGQFSGISAEIPGDVFVTQSATQSLRVEADDNIISLVETVTENGLLTVRMTDSGPYKDISISIHASMTDITRLELAGAGNIETTSPVRTDEITCLISGAGDIKLSGTAVRQTAEITGAGNIRNSGLVSETCSATISGAGGCEVNVTGQLDAVISGVGTITYSGNPQTVSRDAGNLGTVTPSSSDPGSGYHSADYAPKDHEISLSELLRVIQLYSNGSYHCDTGGEDGYGVGQGDKTCAAHDLDYSPRDWRIGLSELLRLIQLYSSSGYHADPSGEDGFSPGKL